MKNKILTLITLLIVLFSNAVSAKDCSQLTRTQCLNSVQCTLELIPKNERKPEVNSGVNYRCRENENECESGFKQGKSAPKDCNKKKSCKYVESGCFCRCRNYGSTQAGDEDAPNCDCECAGGNPAFCEMK